MGFLFFLMFNSENSTAFNIVLNGAREDAGLVDALLPRDDALFNIVRDFRLRS
jgi:hypothetical protein